MNSPEPPDPSRRRLLGWLAGGALAGAGVAAGLYARFGAAYRFEIERHTLSIPGLPAQLAGVRLAQLSDLHIGPYNSADYLERAIAATGALEPDLVLLTGDFVADRWEPVDDLAPLLGQLRPRYGTFACLGNHDVWHGADRIRRSLEAHGIQVLVNSGVATGPPGAELFIAGIDSGWGGAPDMKRALSRHPDGMPVIALVHEPDLIESLARDDRIVLQLSGHSHGGQIRLPGIGAPVLPYLGRRYDLGLYRIGRTRLYTNRGIGVGGIPLRFNCPPEITEFTLVAGDGEAVRSPATRATG